MEGICIFWSLSKLSTEICKSVFMLLTLAPAFFTCTLPHGSFYLHHIQESSYTRESSVLCCLNICDWGTKVWERNLPPFLYSFSIVASPNLVSLLLSFWDNVETVNKTNGAHFSILWVHPAIHFAVPECPTWTALWEYRATQCRVDLCLGLRPQARRSLMLLMDRVFDRLPGDVSW